MEKKNVIRYDWQLIAIYTNLQLENFLRHHEYRFVSKNGKQYKECDICEPPVEFHKLEFYYRSCSSVKCHLENDTDFCKFKYKIERCEVTCLNRLSDNKVNHSDKETVSTDRARARGVHSVMKEEIERLFKQRMTKPMDVLITLTTSQVHHGYYSEADLPSLKQVQREITNLKSTDSEDEYQGVVEILKTYATFLLFMLNFIYLCAKLYLYAIFKYIYAFFINFMLYNNFHMR